MKIFKISSQSFSVANVGSFGSPDDRNRTFRAASWLLNNDPEYSQDKVMNGDDIDLNRGRDFLKESSQYDIVILHHIFNPTFKGDLDGGIFAVSPSHNHESWVKRLVSTGADYIFAYGSFGEVGGGFLGEIHGYQYISGLNGYESIFRNEKLPKISIKEKEPIDWDKLDTKWLEEMEFPVV